MRAGSEKNPVADFTNISDAELRRSRLQLGGVARNLRWNSGSHSWRHSRYRTVCPGLDANSRLYETTQGLALARSSRCLRSDVTIDGLCCVWPETLPCSDMGLWARLCNRNRRRLRWCNAATRSGRIVSP